MKFASLALACAYFPSLVFGDGSLRAKSFLKSVVGKEPAVNRRLAITGPECSRYDDVVRKSSEVIKVDGLTDDWDLTADFFKEMWEAGHCGKNNPINSATAYARYSCDTSTLCILVRAKSGFIIASTSTGSSWLKIYDIASSVVDPITPIQDVYDGTSIVGWEGCFYVAPSKYNVTGAEIHANFDVAGGTPGRTTSTGKPNGEGTVSLDLRCTCVSGADCTAPDGCTTVTCVDSVCVPEAIDGCECDSDGDCQPASDTCKEATCNMSDVDPAKWKCAETDIPDCGGGLCTTDNECFVSNPNESQICAQASCDAAEGTCSFSKLPDATANTNCDPDYVPADDCDLGFFCNGKDCEQRYKSNNDGCDQFTIPTGGSAECYIGQCQYVSGSSGPTVCTPVTLPDETRCGIDRGVCDQGDWCVSGACQSDHFEPGTTECRQSEGCCDAPEFCTGTSYDCPTDLKFGSETTCRDCPDCVANPAEVCDGSSNDCPPDIILDETLCLFAGQNKPAGTVSLTATPVAGGSSYDFCMEITVENWTPTGSEPIKAEFSTTQTPGSAPGQYKYKYPNAGIIVGAVPGTYVLSQCLNYNVATLCGEFSLYFAIHLDVTGASGSETAWALECPNNTELTGNRFANKKGTAFEGWGKYFVWKPCCPGDETCLQCSGGGGGGGGGGDPTESFECVSSLTASYFDCPVEAVDTTQCSVSP